MKEFETRAARQPLRTPELFRFLKERGSTSPHALNQLDIPVLLPSDVEGVNSLLRHGLV